MSDTNRPERTEAPERAQSKHHGRRGFIVTSEDHFLHYSKGVADKEAERLAALNPGRKFYVLRLSRANLEGAPSDGAQPFGLPQHPRRLGR